MTEKSLRDSFNADERAALHSLAEMFQDKDDRDALRGLVQDGATISEIILAYRTQRRMVGFLKATGGMIVLLGATVAALKGLNLWPGK
ncbi:MAG: hypothetical protein MRY81_02020 [Donghicola eburneus]|nr:hypothetical protein [Donghicola eburneus]MCI5038437.1 hypothetical protein [Donghicola eburneus]